MSIQMNHIKNKLQNHEIKPSKMAWDRIEAELDKDKVRIVPMNVRWAAAAMLLVAVTGIIAYNTSQKVDNQGIVNSEVKKVVPTNVPNNVVPNIVKTEVTSTDKKQSLEQNIKMIVPKDKVENKKENNNLVQTPLENTTNTIEEKKNKAVRFQLESPNILAQKEWKFLEIKTKNIDIQRVSEDDEEEEVVYDNLRLPKILNRTGGDSTLTERIITLGQTKAKQVVAKAFQPVLKRFNRN
jgi:hypothetical protein